MHEPHLALNDADYASVATRMLMLPVQNNETVNIYFVLFWVKKEY